MTATNKGKVYLVGAGPGDPDLLTRKAARVLAEADVVLYDRLVSETVLSLASPSAELIYVGKREGEQHKVQEKIFDMLALQSLSGKNVVRLKGGDPLVFGRGAEEWSHLSQLGIEVELVPGVSSATAVPALAGIPVTYRGISHGFAVVTAACLEGLIQDWTRYAKVDTLVVLMGSRTRVHIAESLIAAGRDPEEPAAFIENGATPSQRVIETTLAQIAAGLVEVSSPAVLVIGQTVTLRNHLIPAVQEALPWSSL
ncbi:MAG: uroporphyrinogen-III C-methyltransferase [Acidimicrobiia bacterium]|nr:uroporphyrinogen-III C-methyltransferase [Acidimicrobiia bacterium]